MKMKHILPVLVAVLFLISTDIIAATYYSRANNSNWNNNATWSTVSHASAVNTGTFPQAGDIAIIGNGHVIQVNVSSACASLEINGTGRINHTANVTLSVSGNVTMDGTSQIAPGTANASRILNIGGSFTVQSTATNARIGGLTVNFNGAGPHTNSGTLTFNNNTGVKTFIGSVENSGSWTSTTVTTTGNMVFQNGINNTGTFSAGGATFNTNNQSLAGIADMSFANTVTVTGVTLTNNNTGAVTMTNTAAGTLAGTGTFTQGTGSTLNYAGQTLTVTNFIASSNTNIVNYIGTAGTVTIRAVNHHHLIYSGTVTGNISSAISVLGDLTAQGNGSLVVNGAFTVAVAGDLIVDLAGQISGTATTRILNIGGNIIIPTSATNARLTTLTVNADGNYNQTGNSTSTVTAALTVSGNMGIPDNSTINISGSAKSVTGNLIISNAGIFNYSAASTMTVGNLFLDNTAQVNGVGTDRILNVTSGLSVLSTATNARIGGINLNVNGAGPHNIAGTLTFNNNTGVKTFVGSVVNSGTWTSTAITTTGNLDFRNGITNTGTFSAGGATFNTNNQSLAGIADMSFANTVTVTGVTLTNNSTGAVTMSNTAAGTLAGTGTFTQGAESTLNYAGQTITLTSLDPSGNGNLVNFNNNGNQTIPIPATSFWNLTVSGTSGTKTLSGATTLNGSLSISGVAVLDVSGSNHTINISGNWSNISSAGNPFVERNGTVIFNGSTPQNISAETFYSLVLNNSSGFSSTGNINVTNTLTMTTGNIDMGANTFALTPTTSESLIYSSGSIIGKFQRGLPAASGSEYFFPVGGTVNTNMAKVVRTSGTGNGTITVEYIPDDPGSAGLPLTDGSTEVSNIFTDGYWDFSTSFASGNFNLDLSGVGMTSYTIRPRTRILNRAGSLADWDAPGTHVSGTPPIVSRVDLIQAALNGQFGLANVDARVWYVFQDGFWATPSTWTLDASTAPIFNNPCNEIPGANDQVIIRSGRSVTVQPATNNISISSIEVKGNLYLTSSTGHDFQVINGNGIITIEGNGGTENFPDGATDGAVGFADSDNGGTLVVDGSGNLSLNVARTFRNVIIDRDNSTDVAILAANYSISGDFTVRNGRFQFGDGTTTARSLTVEGNALVENNGSTRIGSIITANANATHTFVMNGNFTNNGQTFFTNRTDFPTTTDRYNPSYSYYTTTDPNRVEVSFTSGTQDQVVNCNNLTYFSRLVVNKGVDATYTLFLQTTDSANFRLLGRANYDSNADHTDPAQNLNAFSLINGTVKLDNNIIIPVLNTTGNYSIPSTTRLWVDGGYVRKPGGEAIVPYGVIEILEGKLVADITSGITLRQAGKLKVDGGSVFLRAFRTSVQGASAQGTYEQNGGAVTIGGGSINASYAQFALTYTGNVFIMTGGTLIIRGRGNLGTGGTRGSFFVNSDPGNQNVTGGTVIFESNTTTPYRITSRVPFYNVIMRAGVASAGNIELIETTCGTGGGVDEPTLAAQPLVVLNDLIINGYTDTRYNNPIGNFPATFTPVTSATNVNDVYIGGSFHVGRYSGYIPVFGGDAPYDAIGDQPTHANTTWFNQTIATSAIDSLYIGQDGVSGNTLELGNFNLNRNSGNTFRTIARNGNNGAIRFDVNGDITVQSGILDQNAYTFRIWGNITNYDRLGTYYASGPYPTASGTPSTAQIRFRESTDLVIATADNSIFGNIRYNVGNATNVTFNSDVYVERMEYLNGRIYVKNHTLTVDEIWNINNGGGAFFNGDVANSSIIQVNNTGIVANILVFTDGKASDGGLRLKIDGNTTAESAGTRIDNTSPITYPLGFTTDGGTTFYSRHAQVKVKDFVDDGYIRINVV